MNPRPTELTIVENRLRIGWDDGQIREYPFRELRSACPCATCREQRRTDLEPTSQLPVVSPEDAQPMKVLEMKPVGNYAYTIRFSDGHDTGIFQFELLRELGETVT